MPTIKNTRLVYSTDPDTAVEKPARSRKGKTARRQKTRSSPSLPKDGIIRVFIERKGRKGKAVSIVRGVPGDLAAKKQLLKQLKKQLGTGGALKDEDIEIQGDHRERIIHFLTKQGYQAKKAGG